MFGWLLIPIYRILDVVQANRALLLAQKQELDWIKAVLAQILTYVTPPRAERVAFVVDFLEVQDMIIKVGQQFTVSVDFKDARGNIAPVDGIPTWANDNESVLTMVVATDGLSAVISSPNGPGSGQISVSADADLGTGITTITGVLLVEVQPLEATVVELNPGPVTDL